MIKRTLYFSQPAYLSYQLGQLLVEYPHNTDKKSVPIEDLAIVLLAHPQITITHVLMAKLQEYNVALITCNDKHLPVGLMMPLEGHSLQSKHFRYQIEASEPLKKKMWQQIVQSKIENQAQVLAWQGQENKTLLNLAKSVKSGDSENNEGLAANYYWKNLFEDYRFKRDRYGEAPNNLLNYGYAILRAMVARSLVGSGLLPTLGLFHRNQYNAYCLADDLMEPYRPMVDAHVLDLMHSGIDVTELNIEVKIKMLELPQLDVYQSKSKSPMMVAIQRTTASLAQSFVSGQAKLVLSKPCLSVKTE